MKFIDLERMAFDFIEKLIEEGNLKKAAFNLWHIAKNNRMRKLSKELWGHYEDAVQLEIYGNAEALDEIFLKIQEGRLKHKLEVAFSTVRKKENLNIEYPKTMKFNFELNEKGLSKKEKELVYNRIAQIRNLGYGVEITKAG